MRTTLCVLGVALGVTLILAIGATTTNYVSVLKEMNQFYPGDVVVVARGSIFVQAISVGGVLHDRVVDEVRAVEGVATVTPMLFVLGSPEHEGVIQISPTNITVGIPAGNWSVLTGALPLQPGGRWPTPGERAVVVGSNLPQRYDVRLDEAITINGVAFTVAGVLTVPSSSNFLRWTILMPLSAAQATYGYQRLISMVVVHPADGVAEAALAARIDDAVVGVRTLTLAERNAGITPIFQDIELWNLGIGSAVSLLNMVLVLLVSLINVSERRRELATLDAIGVPRASIVRMVVTETGLIGLLGGLLGIPLGVAAALSIIYVYTTAPLAVIVPDAFAIVPPPLVAQLLLTTLALSCLAGLLVALGTTRSNIAETMRFDA
jgi:putative ABC transport system permease protein